MRVERPGTYYVDGVDPVPCTLVAEVTPADVVDCVAWGCHDAQERVPAKAELLGAELEDGTWLTAAEFCPCPIVRAEFEREFLN